MKRKKGVIYGLFTIGLTAFILFITIMQYNSNNSTKEIKMGDDKLQLTSIDKKTNIVPKNKNVVNLQESKLKKSKQKQKDDQNQKKTTAKKKEIKEPITYSTKYVTVSSLNIRSGPGTTNDTIGAVTINQSLKVEDKETANGWVKVFANDISGYVNAKYLSDEKVIVQVDNTTASGKSENKKTDINNKEVLSENNNNTSTESKKTVKKEKEKKKSEPKTKKEPAKNDADKLHSIDANNQLILVTSNGYGTSSATIQTFDRDASGHWNQVLNVSGFIGKNGFAGSKVEGDGKSPTGKYSIGTAFGRSGNPGTKLPFRSISADDVWVDDSNSSLYNTWQSKKKTSGQWSTAENMDIALYTYGFVINYNTAQTKGKGSAIFFHVANGHTLGCTGVSQSNMVSILKWIDPAKNPVIIQTPVSELNNY